MIKIPYYISLGRVLNDTFFINSKTKKAIVLHKQGSIIWDYLYKGYTKDIIIEKILENVDEKYTEIVRNEVDKTIRTLNSFGFFL